MRYGHFNVAYGIFLVIATIGVGALLILAVHDRAVTNAQEAQKLAALELRVNATQCAKINRLDDVIVSLLKNVQKGLPADPYYKANPELLPSAIRETSRDIRLFQNASCTTPTANGAK